MFCLLTFCKKRLIKFGSVAHDFAAFFVNCIPLKLCQNKNDSSGERAGITGQCGKLHQRLPPGGLANLRAAAEPRQRRNHGIRPAQEHGRKHPRQRRGRLQDAGQHRGELFHEGQSGPRRPDPGGHRFEALPGVYPGGGAQICGHEGKSTDQTGRRDPGQERRDEGQYQAGFAGDRGPDQSARGDGTVKGRNVYGF